MLKLYGFPKTRARRAIWALEEAQAQYELVYVDLFKGEGRKPPFVHLNPSGKIPALVDGDLVLTESAAICNYIGHKFPESHLVPGCDERARPDYDRRCFFVLSELEQPLWTMAKHRFALPESLRVPEVIPTAHWEFSKALKLLDLDLGDREFIVGGHFTAADILVAHTLSWARHTQVPLEYPRLEQYADRMLSRPAFLRAVEREDRMD